MKSWLLSEESFRVRGAQRKSRRPKPLRKQGKMKTKATPGWLYKYILPATGNTPISQKSYIACKPQSDAIGSYTFTCRHSLLVHSACAFIQSKQLTDAHYSLKEAVCSRPGQQNMSALTTSIPSIQVSPLHTSKPNYCPQSAILAG